MLAQFNPGGEKQEQRSCCLGRKAIGSPEPHDEAMPYLFTIEDSGKVDCHEVVAEFPQTFDWIWG
jgi:hypothetical protein